MNHKKREFDKLKSCPEKLLIDETFQKSEN